MSASSTSSDCCSPVSQFYFLYLGTYRLAAEQCAVGSHRPRMHGVLAFTEHCFFRLQADTRKRWGLITLLACRIRSFCHGRVSFSFSLNVFSATGAASAS